MTSTRSDAMTDTEDRDALTSAQAELVALQDEDVEQAAEQGIVTIHNSISPVRVARRHSNGYVDYLSHSGSGWFTASDGVAQTFEPAAR